MLAKHLPVNLPMELRFRSCATKPRIDLEYSSTRARASFALSRGIHTGLWDRYTMLFSYRIRVAAEIAAQVITNERAKNCVM